MLPAGYRMPIGISVDTCTATHKKTYIADLESVKETVMDYTKRYLYQQMISGAIHTSTENFDVSEEVIHMMGDYVCTEMISRTQQEKNGE